MNKHHVNIHVYDMDSHKDVRSLNIATECGILSRHEAKESNHDDE